jgi:hypothetical protein
MKGSPGATVKLMPCDHEVMGSSPGSNLLQKCRERLHTYDQSGQPLLRTLRKWELRAPDYLYLYFEGEPWHSGKVVAL